VKKRPLSRLSLRIGSPRLRVVTLPTWSSTLCTGPSAAGWWWAVDSPGWHGLRSSWGWSSTRVMRFPSMSTAALCRGPKERREHSTTTRFFPATGATTRGTRGIPIPMSFSSLHLSYSFRSHILVTDQRASHLDQPPMHSRRLQPTAIATMLNDR